MDNTLLWDNNLEEREDHQGEMQRGNMSLANTNHTMEQQSDRLNAKGQENNGNTKKLGGITHAVERDNTSKTREMDSVGDTPQLSRLAHGPTLLQLLDKENQESGHHHTPPGHPGDGRAEGTKHHHEDQDR